MALKPRIYLESTIFNYFLLDDPQRKEDIWATNWNCDHIVRYKTQEIVRAINLTSGYSDLAINTPREVILL